MRSKYFCHYQWRSFSLFFSFIRLFSVSSRYPRSLLQLNDDSFFILFCIVIIFDSKQSVSLFANVFIGDWLTLSITICIDIYECVLLPFSPFLLFSLFSLLLLFLHEKKNAKKNKKKKNHFDSNAAGV